MCCGGLEEEEISVAIVREVSALKDRRHWDQKKFYLKKDVSYQEL